MTQPLKFMPNITPEQHTKLDKLADDMLTALDTLTEAGIPAADPTLAHCAEGYCALKQLLYPDQKPQ
jgi:hypothetical protein